MKTIKTSKGFRITVDDEDYKLVSKYTWYVSSAGYAKNPTVGEMSRFISKTPTGMVCDHINHNTLDNRKENLRNCTVAQNSWNSKMPITNTSGCKGVSWSKAVKKWHVRFKANKEYVHIGYFIKKKEAITACKRARERYHGIYSFAPLYQT